MLNTFACLLRCGIMSLPSIVTIWQIRTLEPGLVPNVKVPERKDKKNLAYYSGYLEIVTIFIIASFLFVIIEALSLFKAPPRENCR